MQKPPEIVFRNVEHSEAVETAIRERLEKLVGRHRDIVGCTVTVDAPKRRGNKGHLYSVGIDLSVRGSELVVNQIPHDDQAHEDIYVAVRNAFDAAERRLARYRQQRRSPLRFRDGHAQGRVHRLFDGFGFINTPGGRHVYFHYNAVLDDGFEALGIGDPVEFVEQLGDDGPQASMVRKIGPWRAVFAGPRTNTNH